MRVKRAGFKPSLNLLYALEGALQDCHWQEMPDERRVELVEQAEPAIAGLPPPRNRPPAGPVNTTVMPRRDDARSDVNTTDIQALMSTTYAYICMKKTKRSLR